jgi:hypothetical protein
MTALTQRPWQRTSRALALATLGALSIVLSLLLGWLETVGPWAFLLGFVTDVVTGLGATLSVVGLVERRRG